MRIADSRGFVNPTKRWKITTHYDFSQHSPTRYTSAQHPRHKNESSQKARRADNSGRSLKRLSGRLRYRSAFEYRFSFGCAWRVLGSASVASRLVSRQAHATVPKLLFFLYIGCFLFQTP